MGKGLKIYNEKLKIVFKVSHLPSISSWANVYFTDNFFILGLESLYTTNYENTLFLKFDSWFHLSTFPIPTVVDSRCQRVGFLDSGTTYCMYTWSDISNQSKRKNN